MYLVGFQVCGDWFPAEPGRPGKPVATGKTACGSTVLFGQRRTGQRQCMGKKGEGKKRIPGEVIISI